MKKRYLLAGIGGIAGAAVAYKFLSRAAETDWESYAKQIHHPENSRFIEVDGLRIHYQEFGETSSKSLILIHGYSASTFTWSYSAPLIAQKGFRVFVVDLIGFGLSEKPAWSDYTIDSQARMIVRFMNRVGIGQAVLVGSSYGGAIALSVALDNPERVEKLVLSGAVCNDDIRKLPLTKFVTVPLVGEMMTPFLTSSKTYVRARMRNSFGAASHHLIDETRITSVMQPLQAADSHRSLLLTLKNWHAARLERDAKNVTQPTLLIWGEGDHTVPLRNGRFLHREIPNSRLIVFKNCGHVPHEEYTSEFVHLVTDFAGAKTSESQDILEL
ncbi:MAG: alpha/beta hydrolase [Acidobacteriota bacterium]|nr:alpha/beta hydrolase [Acidobacteriota bacterium]